MEPRIPLCSPIYTKNKNVRDLLDTPDPNNKILTIQIQKLKPLRARVP